MHLAHSISIESYHRFYAQLIVHSSGSQDERLIEAFAQVPREHFLGPGPWHVFTGASYLPTLSSDPSLAQDWVSNPASNNGVLLFDPVPYANCDKGGYMRPYRSSNHWEPALRPKLNVNYVTN
jgi:hypothetical protein